MADQVTLLDVMLIARNPKNPRKHSDKAKLAELTESVRRHGVLQPVLVRVAADGHELVAGERRWTAAREAGLREIPAIVRVLDDNQAFEISVIENSHREDVNPADEAAAFAEYLKRTKKGDKDAVGELAAKIGHPPAYVKRRLALNGLIAPARKALASGDMTLGAALQLARLPQPLQEKVISELRENDYAWREIGWTVARMLCDLARAPFDRAACANCGKNGGNDVDLFGASETYAGHCLEPECFNRKMADHVKAEEVRIVAEGLTLATAQAGGKLASAPGTVQINNEYAPKMPRKTFRTKCAKCDQLVAFVSPVTGRVTELCQRGKCARSLMCGTALDEADDGGEPAGDVARSEDPGVLAAQRRKIAEDYAAAWLGKTWAEAVIGPSSAPAISTVYEDNYPQLLAWGVQTAATGPSSMRGAITQLEEWIGLDDYRQLNPGDRPVKEMLAMLGALGFYAQASDPLTHKIVSANVRDRAAGSFPITELYLMEHLAANLQAIAKALGVKVPPQRGEAIKAILAAKLPPGTLTPDLAAAFAAKPAKKKKAKTD